MSLAARLVSLEKKRKKDAGRGPGVVIHAPGYRRQGEPVCPLHENCGGSYKPGQRVIVMAAPYLGV